MPFLSPEFFEKFSVGLAAGVGVVIVGVLTALGTFGVAALGMIERLFQARAKRKRKQTARKAEINYTKALMAQHLEAYARSCAETLWHNNDDETQDEGASNPPDFPDWPNTIDWTMIGATEMIKGRDIELRVRIRRETIDGYFRMNASSLHEAREIFADGAARIGLEAFKVADDIRREIGVKPFRYPPHGIDHRAALQNRVNELDNRVSLYRQRRLMRWLKQQPREAVKAAANLWSVITR